MKKLFLLITASMMILSATAQEEDASNSKMVGDTIKVKTSQTAESKVVATNRNVMLNAENNTNPREINIGLPANVGGMTILEDGLPVVYYYWPDMPTFSWRQSVGLSQVGLMGINKVAATLGDMGYAVDSYSQMGTEKLRGIAKLTTNSFGWLQGDFNVSGPLGKGWAYTAGAFLNFDPGTTDLAYTTYNDETKIYRVGLTKFFNNNRGEINFLYKYATSRSTHDYAFFEYQENGKVKEMDNFKIGRDSYILRSGQVRLQDIYTGDYYWSSIGSKNGTSVTNNFGIFGNYKLNNDWNFHFSTRLHLAKASIFEPVPTAVQQVTTQKGYKLADGTPYSGYVGTIVVMSSPHNPVTDAMGRFWLTKNTKHHKWEFGMFEMFHKRRFTSDRTFYQQTLEPQPQLLFSSKTDQYGFYNYGKSAAFHDGLENKLSVYGHDKWKASKNLNINYGLNLRYHLIDGQNSPTERVVGFNIPNAELTDFHLEKFHFGGFAGGTYNITKSFGALGNVQYTQTNNGLEGYNLAAMPDVGKSKTKEGAIGIFWNNPYIQLVSQLTYVRKSDYLKRFNFVNPNDASDATNKQVYYDIQTIGWTTDFNIHPFKGAMLHFLFTLQNPQYKNFDFEVYGNNYDYNNKNVLSISKTLMEIDPSYTFGKANDWRVWTSFRYNSKVYANITNVLYFEPHWETFGGVDYKMNKNIKFALSMVNFLNQRGAKGNINGSELITDPKPYYGTLMTGFYMMPSTVRFTATINF